jgi:uncharacterized protein (TIGR02996 family)
MTAAPPAAVPPLPAPYLRQILAHPGDDGPRLVAADWWDEQGAAERAEFVRVQCKLARLPHYGTCLTACAPPDFEGCPNRAQRRREWELYRGEWDAEVIPAGWVTADEYDPAFTYRRGFVEEVICPAADFLAHADALLTACPLRRVALTTPSDLRVNRGYTYSLPGRPAALAPRDGESWDSLSLRLLKAEFPGIDFELLPVGLNQEMCIDVPGASLQTLTGQVAAPREGTRG